MKTIDIFNDSIQLDHLECQHMSCKNVNAKKKEYEICQSCPTTDLKYAYSQLYYHKKPDLMLTTPIMICPFGINNQGQSFSMCLQFSNYTADPEMKRFLEFMQECEYRLMKLVGLTEEDSELFISQIKFDKLGKYDPHLQVKVPFSYNRFQTDIYSDEYELTSIMNISKFCKLQCDIYIDKIWKYNDKYICKWKVKMIHQV